LRADRKAYWFTIEGSGEVIGQIGLVGIAWPNRRAGIAVWLLPAARGTGAAREALELIVEWAQRELELHRIEIHTLRENERMQACAEAAGFTREGVLRDYSFERGQFRDNVVYSRLPA
jgi:RimJ/RimL family protein N-acetyltransferase